jgi:hypothetical protein
MMPIRELEERLAIAELAVWERDEDIAKLRNDANESNRLIAEQCEKMEAECNRLRALLLSIINALGLPARGRAIAAAADALKDAP